MDYDQYIKDATRSESRVDAALTQPQAFRDALRIFILAGQVLDLYKRQIFYGKDFAPEQIEPLTREIAEIAAHAADTGDKREIETNTRILHAAMGFATESGEIMEALVDSLDGKGFDVVNFMEELGDLNWYQAVALDETGLSLEETCVKNINKLKARFPEKFSETHAIERDLGKERDILESKGT